ncbi:MAG: AI-2E family transporter [Coriobacteriia bacterium]|nr:AI-2E family transporter [Coriobacteriia bacterium]
MPSLTDRIRNAGSQISELAPSAIPGWLMTGGISGWLIVGCAGALAVFAWLFQTSASISIPLLLAMVIGMVAYPLCEKLTARGLSKAAAAGIVLGLLAVIVVLAIWITTKGIVSQWPAIQAQVMAGLEKLNAELMAAGWNTEAMMERFRSGAESTATAPSGESTAAASGILASVFGAVSSSLGAIFDLAFGLFIGTTLLYYVLSDFPTMADWIARHMGGLPVAVGQGIVDDAVAAMRGYFRATTITGLVVAATIAVAMLLLGIPLAFTVALVTFLTCYIPYFGAIISGAFAFVVALGTAGLPAAMLLLVIVLLAQNVLQTVINARVMGESLNLHPLVVLVVTMLGGIFAGLLGAALAAPIAALLISAGKRLQTAFAPYEAQAAGEAAVPAE